MNDKMFPACNVHSFIFPDPAAASTGSKFPPTPPQKPIYIDPTTLAAVTYSRLRRDTLRLAHGVHQRFGTPRTTTAFGSNSIAGPVVLVHLPNTITWPVIVLGFLAAGWTVTSTNPGYTSTEMAHIVSQCEPSVVVCQPGSNGEDIVRAACAQVKHSRYEVFLVDLDDDVYGAQRMPLPKNSWISLLSNQELQVSPLSVDEASKRVAIILWTSGTTGKSKGALVSHRAVVSGLVQVREGSRYDTEERWIAVAPFYHVFGLYNQLLLAPCIGATLLVLRKFDLEWYLRLVSAFGVTHMHIAPPVAIGLLNSELVNQPWCKLTSVKAAISGGAPLSPSVIRGVWNRLRIPIRVGYGMSELGGATLTDGDTWEEIESQLGSAGKFYKAIKVTIIGDDEKVVPTGTPGEIILHSPAQMLGYLRNDEATAASIDPRGIRTGDFGYFDERGNIYIVDRLKEIIKYKGFQVSPTELEAIIAKLPEVQDVAVSSIYSDALGTELPRAYVKPQTYQNIESPELIALAEKIRTTVEKHCIYYKYLRGGVTFIPAIPKTPSGKVMRRQLKQETGIHVDCYPTGGSSARL